MSRRQYNRNYTRTLESDREKQGGKIVKAFRRVDPEHASYIGGMLSELVQSGDIPAMNTAQGMQVFSLDPRRFSRKFNIGFLAGVQVGKFTTQIEASETIDNNQCLDVKLGLPSLLTTKRQAVLAPVISNLLMKEILDINRMLADNGAKGFKPNGELKGHRSIIPKLFLGNFAEPLSKKAEPDVMDAIAVGMAVLPMSINDELCLGELEFRTYSVG